MGVRARKILQAYAKILKETNNFWLWLTIKSFITNLKEKNNYYRVVGMQRITNNIIILGCVVIFSKDNLNISKEKYFIKNLNPP